MWCLRPLLLVLAALFVGLGLVACEPGCALGPPDEAAATAPSAPITSGTQADPRRLDVRRQAFARPEEDVPAAPPTGASPPALDPAAHPRAPRGPPLRLVPHARVLGKNGEVLHEGPVDLGPTIDRVLAGVAHRHRNDGAVFQNRERRLPARPSGHYREYVHPTPGLRGPGPQRVVVGADGAWYYTADHYQSFLPLQERAP